MNFKTILEDKEEILYEGRSAIGAESRNVGVFLFIMIFVVLFQILLVISAIKGLGAWEDGVDLDFVLIFSASIVFLLASVYGFFYNLLSKKKHTDNNYYCVTNKRVMKFDGKKNKLFCGNIAKYKDVTIDNVVDNCGDITLDMLLDKEEITTMEGLIKYREALINPDPNDMPNITFEYVRDPETVKKIIEDARDRVNLG